MKMFQFLIGKVQPLKRVTEEAGKLFQFLIGKVQPIRRKSYGKGILVSIPHR